jgi:hypothetical protein
LPVSPGQAAQDAQRHRQDHYAADGPGTDPRRRRHRRDRREAWDNQSPGWTVAGAGRPGRRGRAAGRTILARHAATARPGRGPARRSGGPDLDEPANGLDPQGIRWLRDLLRSLAAEGRAILVSSHILAEVAQTVDDVVVISRGRTIAQAPLGKLLAARHGSTLEDIYLELTGAAEGNPS